MKLPISLTFGNLLLLGACALLLVVRLVTGPESLDRPDEGAAFGAFDPSTILRISLADEAPAEGEAPEPLMLVRSSVDEPWTVNQRLSFPALEYLVDKLLARVDNLRVSDLVSEEAASHAIFGVDTGAVLTLEAPGTAPWSFVLGNAGREGGGTSGYLRAVGGDRVFALSGIGGLSSDPRAWIDSSLVSFDASTVERMEFQIAGTGVALVRDDKGRWGEEQTGAAAQRVPAEDLIGFVGALALDDLMPRAVELAESGFAGDALVLRLDGTEGEEPWSAVIELGALAEDGRRFVRTSAWREGGRPDWAGLLPGAVAADLEGRVHDLLLGIGQ